MVAVWEPDSLWTQQSGVCTGVLRGAPAHCIAQDSAPDKRPSLHVQQCKERSTPTPAEICGGDGLSSDGRRQEQEFFLHPTVCWDNRRGKKTSRSPDFRRKGSGEVLWLNNSAQPAWLDESLCASDIQMDHGASTPNLSGCGKPDAERRAGAELAATAIAVSTLCQQGKLTEAVEALEFLVQTDGSISQYMLHTVLKQCIVEKDVVVGRRVHHLAIKLGYESTTYLGNHILRMYACAGRLREAMDVFTRVGKPDVFMWVSIISAHAKHGKPYEAVQLYHDFRASGVKSNSHIFVAALKACTCASDLESGRKVHSDLFLSGIPPNLFVGNCLVGLYAKCGVLEDARQVFESLAIKDSVTWTTLISGYANHGFGEKALVLHGEMKKGGMILDNPVTLSCLLKACASTRDLEKGRQLHSQIMAGGQLDSLLVATSLVDMYAKCGELRDAREVFDSVRKKDVVTWTALIAGYANNGLGHEALALYGQMEQEGLIMGNHITYSCLLKACASTGALQKGRELHSQIVEREQLHDVRVGTCLVDMYVKCSDLDEARRVFDGLAMKNVATWTALIAGYAQQGFCQEALVLYGQMEQEDLILADSVTFSCLLKACASAGALQEGRQLHSLIVERGQLNHAWVSTCLVDMYAKCGELEDARGVFNSLATKDVATWTALIAGYVQQGLCKEALVLYGQMEEEGLIVADSVTFACLLKACSSAGALQEGRRLHSQIVEKGELERDMQVGTCLVDMYGKCGEVEEARRVFDNLAAKDVATWTAMIAGYARKGVLTEALVLYREMEEESLILADSVTFACLLNACASAGALQEGRQLHSRIVGRVELERDILVGNCLVDMYAKCGKLEDARRVFDSLVRKDVVTWNALIAGYGSCDEGYNAVACFDEMVVAGIQPDEATFTCLLAACGHEGLVTEGRKHFDSMVEQHGITPTIQHYNCLVDLLARAGHLDDAENTLFSCERQDDVVGLMSLLHACKSHGDIERATRCFETIVKLDPQGASAYVLMANVYADAGMWADVERIEKRRTLAGARKKPAVAGIEVDEQVHTFVVGEHREDLSMRVETLNARLKEEGGHVPHTKLVLKQLPENEKEDALCGHAEKLALAYGLLNTPIGTPLLVTKNLRMCSDCHTSTEIMSRVEKRDIVVRDGYRVHRFAAGCCSCRRRP